MKIKSVKLVYFSPTGTGEAVARGIASGLGSVDIEPIDITRPDVRAVPLSVGDDELLIIAVPVYMGRVPALLGDWLKAMQLDHTPAVCVVVYGNRAYEDALLELKDMVTQRGGIPVAGAAYIGEHSFANADAPVALGRPDAVDLGHAKTLGEKVREKLRSIPSTTDIPDLAVPGEHPYGGRTELWNVDFIEVGAHCVQCGLCAEVCPVGAIDPDNSAAIDQVKCITCCACIKQCPQSARTMKPGPVMEARKRLSTLCMEPKQPESFI